MLYKLLYSLHTFYFPFNVFRYITFRSALAVLTALAVTLVFAPPIIRRLRGRSVTEQIREDGPEEHKTKEGTPTMGGLIILLSIFVSMLLWGDLSNPYVIIVLVSLALFGSIGLLDDYLKIAQQDSKGLRSRTKFSMQIACALGIGLFLHFNPMDAYTEFLSVPFFKKWLFNLGWFYLPFTILVIVGSSNAVNLTDGMDGLAIGLVAVAALANAALVYISGHRLLADYLQVLYLPQTGELAIFCGALFGSALGFLWYNCHPAEVFMGDVGSLGLGGALGTLAIISKQEIVLTLVGGIFVAETLSVMLQVASFKLTGKRVFKMAPLHHHFELKGWKESKVIVRFWIAGIMLALLSLATLKVR
jgi:phospho-N-acetylmuramoyl-pentapeptide-transferase